MSKPNIKASINFTQWELEDMLDKLCTAEEETKVRTYAVQTDKKQMIELTVTVGQHKD
jgi:hypothetical protein